jgi:perosamine synthetase
MFNIKLMCPNVTNRELELVAKVLESEHLVEGPMTRKFEKLISDYIGVKHAIACTSATTGLEMCLRAIGVGEGDEVIIPDFTHPATGLSVMAVGATPVLVDVDKKTYNTNISFISDAITDRTKAVIPVSWGGQPLFIDEIIDFCRPRGIVTIDDAACSLGTHFKGIPTGRLADFTVFSFHPRKIFSTGDGGCITTNDNRSADYLRSYKNFGVKKVNGVTKFYQLGTNQRFSSILAAVGVAQIERIDQIVNERIRKAEIYNSLLKNNSAFSIPFVIPDAKHNYQSYTLFINETINRDYLLSEMRHKGIEVQIGTLAINREPVFNDCIKKGSLDNSNLLADSLLTLPLHNKLTEADQNLVAETLMSIIT